MDSDRVYQLLTTSVVPRPIAWVSTRSESGIDNLAPYSFFTISSVAPPIVQFTSVGRKDSLANIEQTGEFVVNLTSEPLIDQVNGSSAAYGPAVSEFDALGVTSAPSIKVSPLRVKAAPVSFECVCERVISVGNSHLVLGRVVFITANSLTLDDDGLPATKSLAPLSRLGRTEWGLTPEIREVTRPRVPE